MRSGLTERFEQEKESELVNQFVVPALRITDYQRSKAFYVNGLGFHIEWEHRFEPHLPVFMQISREGLVFYLTQHSGDCQAGGLIHLFVPDVDAWFTELTRKGVPVRTPPSESIPGLRDMTVVDPDDNKLRVCTRVKS
jgi:catechol 2,3-dioxygenase-like lactoylglutathione lyase family enzyme